MKFGYTILYVEDVEKTLLFYENAFGMVRHFLHESKQYGELDTGETKLAFASGDLARSHGVDFVDNDASKHKAPGFEIAFVSDDIKQSYDRALRHGARSVKGPAMKPWGQEVAYVRDLNGILVELCTPMG